MAAALAASWIAALCITTYKTSASKAVKCDSGCECAMRLHNALAFYTEEQERAEANLALMTDQILKLTIAATAGDDDLKSKSLPALAATGEIFQTCRAAAQAGRKLLADHEPKLTTAARAITLIEQLSQAGGKTELTARTGAGQFTATSLTTKTAGTAMPDECAKVQLTEERTKFDPTNESENMLLPELTPITEVTINCKHGGGNTNCVSTGITQDTGKLTFNSIIKIGSAEATTGTKTRGSTELEATIQGIQTELYTAKGTDHDAIGFLGTKHGNGKGDCDGDHATNKGACANFKKANGEVAKPKWLTNLQAAATAARQEEEKERAVAQAVARIRTLNSTLTTLLATSMIATQLGDHKQTVPTTTRVGDKSKNQQEEAEKECNKVNSEDECRGKTDCTYDKQGKKCTLSKEAKKEAEKEAKPETGGKDDKKDRCNKHGTDKTKCEAENTAGQTPVCGFRKGKEGETDEPDKEKCRNGSFLTSKQFALSVVSAAFVALLF
uniref:Variant surface glycoprotein 1125.4312 n=1 Tax=Trypanosoma brucei TaxID=5691 RepID=A0A1J0RAL8_9TRYP|nr:variant surface glycoprotein 1125.4312 [Trypanosoma brucei]